MSKSCKVHKSPKSGKADIIPTIKDWVGEFKKKLEDWNKEEPPKTDKESVPETPTAYSERVKRHKNADPTGSWQGVFE